MDQEPVHTKADTGMDARFAVPELHEQKAPRVKALSVALLLLASMAAGFIGGWAGTSGQRVVQDDSKSVQQQIISSESQLINSIATEVGPSVVSIDVVGSANDSTNFFSYGSQASQSAGTGIIIASNGLIVTNRHVVPEGTTDVNVTLSDGTELDDVSVLGRTRSGDSLDIAFLKINDAQDKKLTAAKIGDSTKVAVGDKVVAIGNALGQFQNTVTSGIISGYGRSVDAASSDGTSTESLQDLFQTDAAINEGNSGGPLVNINGEVIGINTAIAGDAEGIGFAIPTADISGLIKTVISTGKFEQPYLGVRYIALTSDIADQLKLKVDRGAYILTESQASGQQTVLPDSPAAKAGLKPGDVVVEIDGTAIDDRNGLTVLLNQKGAHDTVKLKVLRGDSEMSIDVVLEPSPTNS